MEADFKRFSKTTKKTQEKSVNLSYSCDYFPGKSYQVIKFCNNLSLTKEECIFVYAITGLNRFVLKTCIGFEQGNKNILFFNNF